MKRVVLLGAVLLLFSCPTAFADNINVGDIITLGPATGGGTNGGGPFSVNKGGSFQFTTFCVELTEHFSYGTEYLVKSITSSTVLTGHALTNQTAWLYYMYRTDPSVFGSTIDLAALQVAIWQTIGWGVSGMTSQHSNDYVNLANLAVTGGWVNSNVRIMNLAAKDGTGNKQDQLVLVPEPSALLLLGLGLVSVSLLSRRHSSHHSS